MLIDFVGALAAGLGLLGVVLLINRVVLRNRFGGWIYPATVALGMVAYTVWAEYTWADRTIEAMPQLALVSESGDPVVYRPWTYVFPQTTRMVTIDRANTRTHPGQPGLVMTRVVLVARWQPMQAVGVVYDCQGQRRADLTDGVSLGDDGSLDGAQWHELETGDAAMRIACEAGGEGSDVSATDA